MKLNISSMSEKKDPAIKLFGRTIQLLSNSDENLDVASEIEPSTTAPAKRTDADCHQCTSSDQNILCSKQSENRGDQKTTREDPVDEEEQSSSSDLEECKTQTNPSSSSPENSKPLSNDKKSPSQDLSKMEEDHSSDQTSSTTHSQDHPNPPKKPDKILPCPRCSSMDTKFCYFNNYNVNQPRHFCKNCQRYWTAGGTMRNVPVGAGRRKNKNSSASQNRHLLIPDHGFIHHHASMRPNGTVLAFGGGSCGPDSPLISETMVSLLKLADNDKPPPNCVPNVGFIAQDMRSIPIYFGGPRSGKENSNSNNPISTSLPCSWNPIPWQSGLPVSFIAAPPYLGCSSMQFLPTTSIPSTLVQQCPADQSSTSSSSPNSPLGKHARDENSRVVIPKTLRIDDPTEAAKSSIWDTLGIKKDKALGSPYNMIGGFFGGSQPSKDAENNENFDDHLQNVEGSSMVLQANPAAFSRSLSFHEAAQ